MKYKTVKETMDLTHEFLNTLRELVYEEKRMRADRKIKDGEARNFLYASGTKFSSAVRRKSLDLTRKLAELRKP